jgi:hypothetical protein
MKLHDRFETRSYEQRSKEIRKERQAEMKQVERLSAKLAKRAASAKATELTDRAA